jgi:hypothetical protein
VIDALEILETISPVFHKDLFSEVGSILLVEFRHELNVSLLFQHLKAIASLLLNSNVFP